MLLSLVSSYRGIGRVCTENGGWILQTTDRCNSKINEDQAGNARKQTTIDRLLTAYKFFSYGKNITIDISINDEIFSFREKWFGSLYYCRIIVLVFQQTTSLNGSRL